MKKILLFIVVQLGVLVSLAQNRTQLIVHAPVLAPNDTLLLQLQDIRIGKAHRFPYRTLIASNQNGVFHFDIDSLNAYTWASLGLSFQKTGNYFYLNILDESLLMKGDSVHMYLRPKKGVYRANEEGYDGQIPMINDNWDASFTGRGAEKFEAEWKIKILSESDRMNSLLKHINAEYPAKDFLLLYRLEEEALALLEGYKRTITPHTYKLLRNQAVGKFGYDIGRQLEVSYFFFRPKGDVAVKFQAEVDKFIARGEKDLEQADDDAIQSPRYMDYLSKFTRVAFYNQKPTNWGIDLYYEFANKLLRPSTLKDRILGRALLEYFVHKPQKALLENALITIKDPYSRYYVEKLKSLLKGTIAYDFSLPDVNGRYHKAADFSGKVVFMDFWYAACGPCKQYMKDVVRPVKEHFKDNPNVVFITVSTDSYQKFASMVGKTDFLPKGGVHLYTENQYFKHPIIKHYNIKGYPYPLLINKKGEVSSVGGELRGEESLIGQINEALTL